jgi:hypothetical protein
MDLAYHPNYPHQDLALVVSGSVILISASVVMVKIYTGSKNKFAFTLMAFSQLLALSFLGQALSDVFRRPVYLNGKTYYFGNQYVYITSVYLDVMCSLQYWVFASRYWYSASQCALTKTIFSGK